MSSFISNFSVYAGGIFFPILGLFMNLLVRFRSRLPASTGADLLLLAVFLDATMLMSPSSFSGFIIEEEFRKQFVAIVLTFLFICISMWLLAVIVLESNLHRLFDRKTGRYQKRLCGTLLYSSNVALVTLIALGHVMLFRYEIGG